MDKSRKLITPVKIYIVELIWIKL